MAGSLLLVPDSPAHVRARLAEVGLPTTNLDLPVEVLTVGPGKTAHIRDAHESQRVANFKGDRGASLTLCGRDMRLVEVLTVPLGEVNAPLCKRCDTSLHLVNSIAAGRRTPRNLRGHLAKLLVVADAEAALTSGSEKALVWSLDVAAKNLPPCPALDMLVARLQNRLCEVRTQACAVATEVQRPTPVQVGGLDWRIEQSAASLVARYNPLDEGLGTSVADIDALSEAFVTLRPRLAEREALLAAATRGDEVDAVLVLDNPDPTVTDRGRRLCDVTIDENTTRVLVRLDVRYALADAGSQPVVLDADHVERLTADRELARAFALVVTVDDERESFGIACALTGA